MAATIRLKAVVEALETASDEMTSYLNPATGEIRSLTEDEAALAEAPEGERALQDWEREAAAHARQVLSSDDWVELPNRFEIHEWSIMERFAHSLADVAAREDVVQSLRGTGVFGHFKIAVRRQKIEQDWFAYRARALAEIARAWLDDRALPYE